MTAVHRIPLENPLFDMEGATNAYLLAGDDVTLIDCGVATATTRSALERDLDAQGLTVADIDHLLLTHWHPDHAGLARSIQEAGGTTVHVHAADAAIVEGSAEAFASLSGSRETSLERWGLPADVRAEIGEHLGGGRGPRGYGTGDPPTVHPIQDGDVIPGGEWTLEALHTPGHTVGETCFVLDRGEHRDVFTGDALLPNYTANVGGADPRTEGALDAQLESLSTLVDRAFDRGWPGHGDPMDQPAARAAAVLTHHRDRSASILSSLAEPMTVWEVARSLFGALTEVHLMLGLGETHAHLEYLRDAGLVERTGDQFVATTTPSALDAVFPEVPG